MPAIADDRLEERKARDRSVRRRRRLAVGVLVVSAASVAFAIGPLHSDGPSPAVLVPRKGALTASDPLAYRDGDASALEAAAAFALSHPLYTKSSGGVRASAQRTARFRSPIETAAASGSIDADTLEAIVFLESGGRPEVIAGDDPAGASGLTQILAETATNFLGMSVDLTASRRLTAAIVKAAKAKNTVAVERLRARRRAVDARFDPELALAGTVRYLETAQQRLGRSDLAVVSYHMGIGNLTNVLRAYAGAGSDAPVAALVRDRRLSWARVFFDTTPSRHAAAYELLSRLGDSSPSYYWRVLAAKEIMRLYRDDPERLLELDALHRAKASAEEVLHPLGSTDRFDTASNLEQAWRLRALQPLPDEPARLWFTVDATMGELAPQLGQPVELYRGLRPEALAVLVYIAQRVHALSGATRPLEVTSSVRDEAYQRLLRIGNPEATYGYSLHTTGYAFDIRRRYESPAQAAAFQFELDRLRSRSLITWVREPGAIHIVVSSAADVLVPVMLAPE